MPLRLHIEPVRLQLSFAPDAALRVAQAFRVAMQRRVVGRGQGSSDTALAPYTPAYARRKGSTRVDLTVTGRMFQRIVVAAESPTRASYGLEGTDYGRHVEVRRPFLTPSADDRALVDPIARDEIVAAIGRAP